MVLVRHRVTAGGALALALAIGIAQPALAGSPIWGGTTQDGARMNIKDRADLQQVRRDAAAAKGNKAAQQFEYGSASDCGSNTPESASFDDLCAEAVLSCVGNTPQQGLGPSVRLFRRPVDAAGVPTGAWVQYGTTCLPQEAPGPARPALTMAMVVAAFHDTAFARAQLEVQPRGNLTLVGLPTYFEVRWPRVGFGPGEVDRVDPARMAGFAVEIRPVVQAIRYVFGDGSGSGPTTSRGGPYPSGDVVKAYPREGTYPVRADVTFGGQFRVNRGEWIDIPGTVTIRGTSETLHVRTAEARLVTR